MHSLTMWMENHASILFYQIVNKAVFIAAKLHYDMTLSIPSSYCITMRRIRTRLDIPGMAGNHIEKHFSVHF